MFGRQQNNPPSQRVFAAAHREGYLSIHNETGAPYGAVNNAMENPDDRHLHEETVDAI